jgi:hypothetical protein
MTSLQNRSARYFSASRLRGIWRMTRKMKLPVPTNGSRMATPGDASPSALPNSRRRMSSTERTMKSTMACGV